MKLLAFDTSTEALSVAVVHGAAMHEHAGAGGAQASSTLIPAVQALMARAGLQLAELDAIAFGAGPGSFTGLRTACSVAQGLAFGTGTGVGPGGVPLLPVDTLLAVAEEARARFGVQRVLAALDARMDELYAARFVFDQDRWTSQGGFELVAPEALAWEPGWALAGNAWAPYGARLGRPAGEAQAPVCEVLPSAAAMLRLAPALLAAGRAVPAAEALPHYIRDKVAKTTEERAAEKRAAEAAAGGPAAS